MSASIGEHLQMVREDPDSNEARFVIADVYEEQGNLDRANFIRLQLERSKLPAWDAERLRIELKERVLLAANESAWRQELPDAEGVRWGQFERGYPRRLAFDSSAALAANLKACIEACPAYGLMLRWPKRDERGNLPPAIDGLRELTIVGTLMETDDAKWLADSPLLAQLHTLNLIESEMNGDALTALLASPHLDQLKALRLPIHSFGNPGMEALVSSSLPALRDLDISVATEDELGSGGRYEETMDADGATLLAAWESAKQLETLNISGNQIGQRGVEMLLSTPHLAGLRDLRIASIADWDYDGDGKPDVLSPFASAEPMTLEVLDVGETDVMAGAEALANAPALAELKILHMSRPNQDEQLRVLLNADWFDELRVLSSSDGFAILRPILDRQPENLHTLNLPSKYYWSRPDSLVKALKGLEPNPTLLQLDLGGSGFEPKELEAMGEIKALPNLLALRIFERHWEDDEPNYSEEAAEAFASSTFGARLESLTTGHDKVDRLPMPDRVTMGSRFYSGPLQDL